MNIDNDLSILLYSARRAGMSSETIANSLRARAEAEEAKPDTAETFNQGEDHE